MARRRNLKSLKPDLPPFRPLSASAVRDIADAGEIKFHDHSDALQFERRLDHSRTFYMDMLNMKANWLTARQIEERLTEALDLTKRLLERLNDPALLLRTPQFPTDTLESLHTIVRWAEASLEDMKERKDKNPNAYGVARASKPELHVLLRGLVRTWRFATGTIETQVVEKSPLIKFLREAVGAITQTAVSIDAAKKWARWHSDVPDEVEPPF